jgi:hypothetical protein
MRGFLVVLWWYMYGDALTTTERVKSRLSITSTDFDDLFDSLILAVTARIQQMTGRRFIQATYTHEMHDGSDAYGYPRRTIIPQNAPIQAVLSVEYRSGTNTNPRWTVLNPDFYTVNKRSGLIHFETIEPGRQNIRITYVGGYSGYSIGINNFWFFNVTPTGVVDGTNRTFTLPEAADEVIVYVDGVREVAANVTFTPGTDTFTLATGRAPYTTIAVDYKRSVATSDADYHLPADLVDVCERAVAYLFKQRDNEGRSSESFGESAVTLRENMFNPEMLATIKNYRRGYNL